MERLMSIQRHLIQSSRLGAFQTSAPLDTQEALQAFSVEHPETFWGEAAKKISWTKFPTKILDSSKKPFTRWFVDGELNACYNAIDRHVDEGHGNRIAIYHDSPVTHSQHQLTYSELKDKVSRVSGILVNHGIKKGDTVIIYMPMIPETLIAMLACARIGAVHSVVFGGFAPKELAKRIEDSQPKFIFSASCGIEPKGPIPYKPLLDEAIEISLSKTKTCIFQRKQAKASLLPGRDFDWDEELARAKPQPCLPVEATHPMYILYTSGTTGKPKGVLRDHGGHAVALKWSMENLYATQPGEVFWAASDFGWVVGHSYIVYGPLLQGCTTVIFEGKPIGTPDAGTFWRVVQQYNVSCMFVAPTVLRTLKKEDPEAKFIQKYAMPSLRSLFLAGERSDPDSLKWAMSHLRIPIIDHWWMTETGWAITGRTLGINPKSAIKIGSAGTPIPGFNVTILDDEGREAPRGAFGNIVVRLPLPPGCLPTLYKNDERYQSSYLSRFPGFFDTGDAGFQDRDDFVFVMSRTDDLINVAGHRLSTGSIEEVLTNHPKIAEAAVIGAADKIKGEKPVGFIVLKSGVNPESAGQIIKETIAQVRAQIGAFTCYDSAYVVARLPKTRSGKILRRTLRSISNKEKYDIPATIDDPAVLKEIDEICSRKA